MPRAGKQPKRIVDEDPIFRSRLVTKIVNRAMKDGEKSVAEKQIYLALEILKEKTGKEPLEVLTSAIENVKPTMEVHARRIGGAAYQVPQPVRGDRRESLAIRWIILAARARANKDFHSFGQKLAAELLDAVNNQGAALKKKLDMHRMAEANKAFSHFKF